MKDIISVIVPIYKVENYLKKCIESIINQTYKNIEIILIDDGSPDLCGDMCNQFEKSDSRIKVIHKVNGGLSSARNVGIENAIGKYIVFVDSDDYIEKNMIERLYIALKEEKADMAVCGYTFINEEGDVEPRISSIKDEILSRELYYSKLCTDNNYYYVTAWNKLYKRELWQELRFPEGKIHEDEFVIHHIVKKCEKIVTISECLYWYVQRKNSIMSEKISIKRFDMNEALCDRCEFFGKEKQKECLTYTLGRLIDDNENLLTKFKIKKRQEYIRIKAVNLLIRKVYVESGEKISRKRKIRLYFPRECVMLKRICCKSFRYICLLLKMVDYCFKLMKADYVLIDTPTHGNLGDQAIVLAEQQLLNNLDKKFVELTAEQINNKEKYYALLTPKNKIILIPGGGFLGELWVEEEYRCRRITEAFSKHKVVIFPQTITFTFDNPGNQAFFEKSRENYSNHKALTLFVREQKSYDFARKMLPEVKCFMEPDIVLKLKHSIKSTDKRTNILLCVRSDCEKRYGENDIKYIRNILKKIYPEEKVQETDTVINESIKPSNRKIKVEEKLIEFSQAKLVITDRLHGMIFAAITGTPCIAINNQNGKVEQVYKWIEPLEYVCFANGIQEIEDILDKLNINKEYIYENKFSYEKIKKALLV